jgi:hypothetical protein
MSKRKPPTETEFLQIIDSREVNIPNCRRGKRSVIKAGPAHYKLASVLEFANANTGVISSRTLNLITFKVQKSGGFDFKAPEAHWSCDTQGIKHLRDFLEAIDGIESTGTHTVIKGDHAAQFQDFISRVGEADLSVPQLMELIVGLAEHSQDVRQLPELGETDKLRMVAAAIRVAHRSNALTKLQVLIDENALEGAFQLLLDQNWWMLGSHYVERIDRRKWTNEETIDIMLRSADDYFDIIELKRSNASLFKQDHGKWIITAEVSDAVNQAAHYISEIERERAILFQRYKVDLYKLKAKVLIGCIGEDEEEVEEKRATLRMLNSHLHRIEVITYDALVRIAENVVSANIGESGQDNPPTEPSDDILF